MKLNIKKENKNLEPRGRLPVADKRVTNDITDSLINDMHRMVDYGVVSSELVHAFHSDPLLYSKFHQDTLIKWRQLWRLQREEFRAGKSRCLRNQKEPEMDSLFQKAAKRGHIEVVKFLLETLPAEIIKELCNSKSLATAHPQVLEYLLQHHSAQFSEETKYYAFRDTNYLSHLVILRKHTRINKIFLKQKLADSIEQGQLDIVRFLCETQSISMTDVFVGANPSPFRGERIIHIFSCTTAGNYDTVKYALEDLAQKDYAKGYKYLVISSHLPAREQTQKKTLYLKMDEKNKRVMLQSLDIYPAENTWKYQKLLHRVAYHRWLTYLPLLFVSTPLGDQISSAFRPLSLIPYNRIMLTSSISDMPDKTEIEAGALYLMINQETETIEIVPDTYFPEKSPERSDGAYLKLMEILANYEFLDRLPRKITNLKLIDAVMKICGYDLTRQLSRILKDLLKALALERVPSLALLCLLRHYPFPDSLKKIIEKHPSPSVRKFFRNLKTTGAELQQTVMQSCLASWEETALERLKSGSLLMRLGDLMPFVRCKEPGFQANFWSLNQSAICYTWWKVLYSVNLKQYCPSDWKKSSSSFLPPLYRELAKHYQDFTEVVEEMKLSPDSQAEFALGLRAAKQVAFREGVQAAVQVYNLLCLVKGFVSLPAILIAQYAIEQITPGLFNPVTVPIWIGISRKSPIYFMPAPSPMRDTKPSPVSPRSTSRCALM